MPNRLLDLQNNLLAYLTSSAAIFGEEDAMSVDPALRGIDRELLHLEARFSHDKRLAKIVGAFPRTFELFGNEQAAVVREFVQACPPVEIGRIENVRQFHAFLVTWWQRHPPNAPHLVDVAACELACAEVRVDRDDRPAELENDDPRAQQGTIRRPPWVVLCRCAFDIRPIFEPDSRNSVPEKRDTRLVISLPPDANDLEIFEVNPVGFDLLFMLDDWTERAVFAEALEARKLIASLAARKLLEVRV
jgi:hypothetical protein